VKGATKVPLEDSPPSGSDRPAEQESDGETTAARREYEGYRLSQAERWDAGSDDPDVLLVTGRRIGRNGERSTQGQGA
jgi:hypothetical protein